MVMCIRSPVSVHVHVNPEGTEAVGLAAVFVFRTPFSGGGVVGCSDVFEISCINGVAWGKARKDGTDTVRGRSFPLETMFGVEI